MQNSEGTKQTFQQMNILVMCKSTDCLFEKGKYLMRSLRKSPKQIFEGTCSISSSKIKTKMTIIECGHNLMSVTHKVLDHHLCLMNSSG